MIYYWSQMRFYFLILFFYKQVQDNLILEKKKVLVGYQKPIKIYDTELSDYTVEVRAYPKEIDVVAKQFIYLNFDVAKSVISAVEDSGN